MQASFGLGALDDADGGAVLDAAAGVQVFELGIDVGNTGRRKLAQVQQRRFADQLRDVLGDTQAGGLLERHGRHSTG